MKRSAFFVLTVILISVILLGGCKKKKASDYETVLFDSSVVHTVDIVVAQEDRADQLENPVEKTKYHADVTIDGETYKDVSFSTKGNSSLIFVAADDTSDRYSYKIDFGKYVEGQNYHGLNKLIMNNLLFDTTYLKDYFCFEIFRKAGVPAPLSTFVWIRINGEDIGLYLAFEDLSESFLERNHNGAGVIYKPEPKGIGLTIDDVPKIMEEGLPPTGEAHGADLLYMSDLPEDYPDIFENAETDANEKNTEEVIRAIKGVSEGKDLSKYIDTDEIIRYFAAHNFVLNYDSYTGSMLHNLVLYENKGRLALYPWDYGLAYATFLPASMPSVLYDVTDVLNQGIDSPLIGTTEDERPMWKWIMEDETYQKQYHDAMDALIKDYFESGAFDQEFDAMYELLLPYVEKDPTSYDGVEAFKTGCATLKQFCRLRAESIRKQLDGDLAAVNAQQDDKDKVDASDIHIRDMGAFITGEEAKK